MRDVLYAGDCAEAVMRSLEATQLRTEVFNIGSGEALTVGSAVSAILAASGYRPSDIVFEKNAPVTVGYRVLDCAKAAQSLGWRARHSAKDGIEKTVQWWHEHKGWWKR